MVVARMTVGELIECLKHRRLRSARNLVAGVVANSIVVANFVLTDE